MDDTVSEILRRANLEALIGQYVELKRIGSRLRGKCPFHQEKTPSFYVSVDKGLWHCFGCKAGGNVFQFVMQIEHLTFPEAVEFLANKMGIRIVRRRGKETVSPREAIFKALSDAADYFHSLLVASSGEGAVAYLHNRGVTDATVKAFRLGLSPAGWDGLIKHMTERGVKMPTLVEAGLALQSREDRAMRDYFRGRLMFPVSNIAGRVVGFGARALGDEIPKYLNTAGTSVYQKGDILYGLSLTKGDISKTRSAILVEGYLDLIALHQAGVTNVVATCGTALTPAHIDVVRRFADNVYLAFDGDEAGVSAAVKSARLFLAQGEEAKIVPMPAGTDPDDLVRKKGREAFDERVKGAMTLPAFVIAVRRSREKLDSAAKRKLLSEMAPIFREIKSEMLRREYIDQTASLLLIDPKFVHSLVAPTSERVGRAVLPSFSKTEVLTVGSKKIERDILKQLLRHEAHLDTARHRLRVEKFADDVNRRLYLKLIAGDSDDDISDAEIEALKAELMFEPEGESLAEFPQLIVRLLEYNESERARQTQLRVKDEEEKGDSEWSRIMQLASELKGITDLISRGERLIHAGKPAKGELPSRDKTGIEQRMLILLARNRQYLERVRGVLSPDIFADEQHRRFYRYITGTETEARLPQEEARAFESTLTRWEDNSEVDSFATLVSKLILNALMRQLSGLSQQMNEAWSSGEKARYSELKEYHEVVARELSKLLPRLVRQ